MISKKSQIFMFDMIFSVIIILVSISLIFNYYINVEENIDIYDLNKNILNGFTNTPINSLNSVEIRTMFRDNKIRNIHNTVAQQVSEFYNDDKEVDAKDLTKTFVESYIEKQMNFEITLYNGTHEIILYEKIHVSDVKDFENSKIASVSQRTVFGFLNNEYYGPYIFKIKIWK